ncbi:MAG: hypothetical protein H6595_01785 [Flavobacteriales bacterium]|nr:hypothetical protein [Flavobacteriales bacterium]MCB9166192.1 hypothetical protein [Flavobacteriales bacterium]
MDMKINDRRHQGIFHLISIIGIPAVALSALASETWWVPTIVALGMIGGTILVMRDRKT